VPLLPIGNANQSPPQIIVDADSFSSVVLANSGATTIWIGHDPIELLQTDSTGNPAGIPLMPGQTLPIPLWQGKMYATCLTKGYVYVMVAYLVNLNDAANNLIGMTKALNSSATIWQKMVNGIRRVCGMAA
jgi:hypothetical protein